MNLNIGMERRESIAAAGPEIRAGFHEGVHEAALLEDLLRAHARPAIKGLDHGRQVVLELGDGARRRQVWIEGRCGRLDPGSPERRIGVRYVLVGALAADD